MTGVRVGSCYIGQKRKLKISTGLVYKMVLLCDYRKVIILHSESKPLEMFPNFSS